MATAARPLCVLIVAFVCLFNLVSPYPLYQTKIPNGNRVPNPCDRSVVWQGVGHFNQGGGGARNPFGVAFAANGRVWSPALCQLDSDGDGRTNGVELGDPNCAWTEGQPYPSAENITHPGVCEPLNTPLCQNLSSWLVCPPPFNCPATQQPGVMNYQIRLPMSPVPTTQTTYMCYGVVLPNDTDSHVIALAPAISNVAVVHHMLLYACKDPPTNAGVFTGASVCQMDTWGCNSLIGVWALGNNGQCLPSEFGFRVGPNGFHYAVLQVHWNNPFGARPGGGNLNDSSGFTVFYTSNLRPNNGAVLTTGQIYLDIPPGLESKDASGVCSSRCTRSLQPINIANSMLYMHLLGRSGDVSIIRSDGSVVVLTNISAYDYNSPKLNSYAPAIRFQPGDQFRVNCNYTSSTRTNATSWGQSINDEMCNGFITYWPANQQFTDCNQWRTVDTCPAANPFDQCDFAKYTQVSQTASGICTPPTCTPACRNATQAVADTGCISGDVAAFLERFLFDPSIREKIDLANSCGVSLTTTPTTTTTTTTTTTPRTTTATATPTMKTTTSLIVLLMTSAMMLTLGNSE